MPYGHRKVAQQKGLPVPQFTISSAHDDFDSHNWELQMIEVRDDGVGCLVGRVQDPEVRPARSVAKVDLSTQRAVQSIL